MKRFLILLFAALLLQNVVYSTHLSNQKKLIVTLESTIESIALSMYLKNEGVIKYSTY